MSSGLEMGEETSSSSPLPNLDGGDKQKNVEVFREFAPIKPPNKAKYNQNLEELQTVIADHEAKKATQLEVLRRARENQRLLREERETTNQRKDQVFVQLDHLNEEAKKRNDTLMKLRGGIPHSKQEDVDEQIRKLEYQINKNNFRLAEEKRIVSEIDRLRRSKKNLKEYNTLKEELDGLRGQQNALRNERDSLFQHLRELKKREDDVRGKIKESNTKLDQIRADIDHYKNEKYSLTNKFHEQENEFRRKLRERKEEQKKRFAEEQAAVQAAKQKELDLLEANKVPYEHEMFLCNLLIQYTQSLTGGGVTPSPVGKGGVMTLPRTSSSHLLTLPSPIERRRSSGFSTCTVASDASSHYATPMGCTPAGTPLEGSPPTSFDESSPSKSSAGFYKKKDENNVFFQGTKKSGKKSRAKQQSSKKLLAHNPETFAQFAELHLFPPTQAGDVDSVLEQLKERLGFYQSKSEDEMKVREAQKRLEAASITDTGSDEVNPAESSIQIIVDPVVIVDAPVDDSNDNSNSKTDTSDDEPHHDTNTIEHNDTVDKEEIVDIDIVENSNSTSIKENKAPINPLMAEDMEESDHESPKPTKKTILSLNLHVAQNPPGPASPPPANSIHLTVSSPGGSSLQNGHTDSHTNGHNGEHTPGKENGQNHDATSSIPGTTKLMVVGKSSAASNSHGESEDSRDVEKDKLAIQTHDIHPSIV